jgi:hypothetical protein
MQRCVKSDDDNPDDGIFHNSASGDKNYINDRFIENKIICSSGINQRKVFLETRL